MAFDRLEQFSVLGRLGRRTNRNAFYGVNSAVYLASSREHPQYEYALKICFNLDPTNVESRELLKKFEKEHRTPQDRLPRHENIVRILSVFTDRVRAGQLPDWDFDDVVSAHSVVVVMEVVPQTLAQAITAAKRQSRGAPFFSTPDLLSVISGVLAGVAHINDHRIVHRDLKPDNVLVSLDFRIVRITDFGCCLDCTEDRLDGFRMPVPVRDVCRGGASAYLAPEIFLPDSGPDVVIDYSKNDVFAAGLILYEMCSVEWPYEYFRPLPPVFPAELHRFVDHLLAPDATQRLDARSADELAHRLQRDATYALSEAARPQIGPGGDVTDVTAALRDGWMEMREQAAAVLAGFAAGGAAEQAVAVQCVTLLVELVRNGTSGAKEQAAAAIYAICGYTNNQSNPHQIVAADAGAVDPLVELLQHSTAEGKQQAAATLGSLARNDENKVRIATETTIQLLVALLRDGTPGGKEQAAGALHNLAVGDENNSRIARAGGIEPLVRLLSDGTAGGKEKAAGALWNLSVSGENQDHIARAGGIAPLVALLDDGTPHGQEQAAGALQNLASNDEIRVQIEPDAIVSLVALVQSGTPSGKERAAGALGRLALCSENGSLIVCAGGIDALLELLSDGTPGGKEQAAGALENLSATWPNAGRGIALLVALLRDGTPVGKERAAGALWRLAAYHENKLLIADASAIPPLVALLCDGTPSGQEHAAGALHNLTYGEDGQIARAAGIEPQNNYEIARAGGIEALVAQLRNGTPGGKEQAAGVLWNLSVHSVGNKHRIARAGGIEELVAMTRDGTPGAKEQAAGALWKLAEHCGENDPRIASAIEPLVVLLREGTPAAGERAARTLRLLSRSDESKDHIARAGGIEALVALLQSGTPCGQEEAAGALWNLAVSSSENKYLIARAGGIEHLVTLLYVGTAACKQEAAGALRILAVREDNTLYIARAGAIEPLVALLHDGILGFNEDAAGVLWSLAVGREAEANRVRIARAGGIKKLVALLRYGTSSGKEQALGTLRSLAESDDAKMHIARAGGVEQLVAILREQALGTLMCVAERERDDDDDDDCVHIPQVAGIETPAIQRDDTEGRKAMAAGALASLCQHPEIAARAARAGAADLLSDLRRTGRTAAARTNAASALRYLESKKYSIVQAFRRVCRV